MQRQGRDALGLAVEDKRADLHLAFGLAAQTHVHRADAALVVAGGAVATVGPDLGIARAGAALSMDMALP